MAKRPIVGVTGAAKRFSPSWLCTKLAVFLAGGKALRISTLQPRPNAKLDALVIGGGDDLHPSLYDELPAHSDYDQARDTLEVDYLRQAMAQHLPVLGICRGMQLLNITKGGTLYADINPMRQRTSSKQILLPRKTVRLQPLSRVQHILGCDSVRVNSLHHQAVHKLGQQLSASAHDLDQFTQAIECGSEPLIGVQWHPEYLFYIPRQLRLFRWLVCAARKG